MVGVCLLEQGGEHISDDEVTVWHLQLSPTAHQLQQFITD